MQISWHYNSGGGYSILPVTPTGATYWRNFYERSIVAIPNNSYVMAAAVRHDGVVQYFTHAGNELLNVRGGGNRLSRVIDTQGALIGWSYTAASDEVESYDSLGRLTSIMSRSGLMQWVTYSGPMLSYVEDTFGRRITPTFGGMGGPYSSLFIIGWTDAAGQYFGFVGNGGDLPGRYRWAGYPDGKSRQLHYEDANRPYALTGITNEEFKRFATYSYDTLGRVATSSHAGGAGGITTGFGTPGNSNTSYLTSTVTDSLGVVSTYVFDRVDGALKQRSHQRTCSGCTTTTESSTYDSIGNKDSYTDFSGNKTCYLYDVARNLETSRVEGLAASTTCVAAFTASPLAAPARKVSTEWNANHRMVRRTAEPRKMTTNIFFGDPGTSACAPAGARTTLICERQVQETSDESGVSGFGATAIGAARVWKWTYDQFGRVLTATDPLNQVTTTEYYANTLNDSSRGMLKSVTNAAGHVTTYGSYDALGRAQLITDANGAVTQLLYNARGRLTLRTFEGEPMTYAYDDVGRLSRVTTPDGAMINYGYDDADRVIKISDGGSIDTGNRIVYTLDTEGNRWFENVYDSSGALARKAKREFDSLSRLVKTFQGADTSTYGEATTMGYDGNGNMLTSTDPLSRTATSSYDTMNRLSNVSVPAQLSSDPAHVTSYDYDRSSNLVKVTEPATPHPSGSGTWRRDTSYTYNGFGEITQQVSKDTGTTTFTYDAAGNLKTKTDARGICATYAYDNLNRVNSIGYAGTCNAAIPTETVTYVYDTCTNGKGRLCGLTDKTGSTTYTYDLKGRVTSKTQTVDSLSQTVNYAYNVSGQLETVTLPIYAAKIGYTYANNRIRSVTYTPYGSSTATVIAGCVEHEPFGPVSDWKWGTTDCASTANPHIRLFDLDGRINQIASGTGLGSNKFSYDSAARLASIEALTSLNGTSVPAKSFTYGYADPFDRLTSQTPGMGNTAQTIGYGYDAIGNRRTLSTSSAPPGLVNDSLTITYGADNRPTQWSSTSTGLTLLKINALGQRVKKESAVTGITRFVYDEAGRLLGEYDSSGVPILEHIWLGDLPIATVRSGIIHYVHSDNLGTPRQITTSLGGVVWKWDNVDPFGNNAANELPNGGNIPFRYNLRFPGQYADSETGTNYNYFRDYDPATGKYIESDPIGLVGGINTYAYVSNRPLSLIDPFGLCEVAVWSGGYITGWKPCPDWRPTPPPPTPLEPLPPQPAWPGRVEIPTKIPEDTICYPEKTPPNDWTPRDNFCYAACMGAGTATTALWDAGFETGGDVAEKGAAAAGKSGLKKILKKAVPGYSAYSFQKGVRQANDICNRACR